MRACVRRRERGRGEARKSTFLAWGEEREESLFTPPFPSPLFEAGSEDVCEERRRMI